MHREFKQKMIVKQSERHSLQERRNYPKKLDNGGRKGGVKQGKERDKALKKRPSDGMLEVEH